MKIEADFHRGGWDIQIMVPHHNQQFDYTIDRPVFSVYWVFGVDRGLYIRGLFDLYGKPGVVRGWIRRIFWSVPAKPLSPEEAELIDFMGHW